MSDRLYQQIITETARCGSFHVVHVAAGRLSGRDAERLHASGLQLHAADPVTTEELVTALERADQLTTGDPENVLRLRSYDGGP